MILNSTRIGLCSSHHISYTRNIPKIQVGQNLRTLYSKVIDKFILGSTFCTTIYNWLSNQGCQMSFLVTRLGSIGMD